MTATNVVETAARLFRGVFGSGADLVRPGETAAAHPDEVVLRSLVPLTAVLAVVYLVFSLLDPWFLDPRHDPGAYVPPGAADPRPIVLSSETARHLSLAAALGMALAHLWLSHRLPPRRWTNPLVFGVLLVWHARALAYLLVSPTIFRVELLAIGYAISGCVFLSWRWMLSYVVFATITWFAVAISVNPDEPWFRCGFVVLAAAAVSAVVCDLRRRSAGSLLATTRLDDRFQKELRYRLRLGETASRISNRFLRARTFDLSPEIDWALGEIGKVLRVDRVFLCRFNRDRLTIATIHEWAPVTPAGTSPPRDGHPIDRIWFSEKVLASHVTIVPDVHDLPRETFDDHRIFKRIGARAFASIPLATNERLPWGYLGIADLDEPVDWSADEIQFLRTVGENLLLTIERHDAEKAVRHQEARFRQLFDANLFTVFFANIYGTITDANDAFFELTGRDRAELPIRWDAVIPLGWRAHYEASITRLVTQGVDPPKELELTTATGRPVPVLLGAALLTRERGEFIVFAVDLTEQREAERKIQQLHVELGRATRLGMMGEMAAGLAHEVHQPLAAILNYAHGARRRLERGRLTEEDLTDIFNEIGELCEQAGGVTANIRQFVRGRHPGRGLVPVNDTIRRSLEIARFELREHEIDLELDLAADLPPAHTNATELTQILLNLILNAIGAMQDHEAPARLDVQSRLGENGEVEIRIRDTGPGIPEHNHAQLFDQFFTTKETGLGMGLPLSRSIAESHGGALELLETGPGGTTFLVRLPAAKNVDQGLVT